MARTGFNSNRAFIFITCVEMNSKRLKHILHIFNMKFFFTKKKEKIVKVVELFFGSIVVWNQFKVLFNEKLPERASYHHQTGGNVES